MTIVSTNDRGIQNHAFQCVRAIQAKFKAMPRKYDRGAMNHATELRNTMKLLEVDLIIQRGGSHICVSALVDDVPSKTMIVDANGLREAPGALPSLPHGAFHKHTSIPEN